MKSLSRVQLLATPWTAAHQAPPFMGFSRQECWSAVPSRMCFRLAAHLIVEPAIFQVLHGCRWLHTRGPSSTREVSLISPTGIMNSAVTPFLFLSVFMYWYFEVMLLGTFKFRILIFLLDWTCVSMRCSFLSLEMLLSLETIWQWCCHISFLSLLAWVSFSFTCLKDIPS